MLSYIEISKDNLLHNYRAFHAFVNPSTRIVSVVKGNAYGHGQDEIVSILDPVTDWFAVDDIDELKKLRRISRKPTLVLGYIAPEDLGSAVELDASIVVYDIDRIRRLDQIGKETGKKTKVHIKIDAALGRQGILVETLEPFIRQLKQYEHITVEGVYAHFANIEDTRDFSHAQKQIDLYHRAVEMLGNHGFHNLFTHISSTAGTLVYEQNHGLHSLVRIGIGLYGLSPAETLPSPAGVTLKPVMRWVTHVAQVKEVPAGYSIGYGLTYVTERPTPIGVIPQGYSDGYDRGLSNCGEVLIGGKRCRVLGRVAMNMVVVDLSPIPHSHPGDEVVLLGHQGDDEITAEEIAEKLGTINYEVVTRVSPLLPRVIV